MERAGRRFAVWRRTRTAGSRIPEPPWTLAAELAGVHGLHRAASYYSLKQRAESLCHAGDHRAAAFVELAPPPSLPLSSPSSCECLLEFENGLGAQMRIHLKGHGAPNLASLCRNFWNAE